MNSSRIVTPAAERSKQRIPKKRLQRWVASWSRWLHIYLSLFGLAVILFFSITGLTLNHPDWFFKETLTQVDGTLDRKWLHLDQPPPTDWDQNDLGHEVDKLRVAERLRAEHGLHGHVSDFLVFEEECELTFEAPGYAATARINRDDGRYTIDILSNDLVTIMNDLHKGRHTSRPWKWLIDVSAVIGVLTGLSGFVLIFFLRLKRATGLITAAIGMLVAYGVYAVS